MNEPVLTVPRIATAARDPNARQSIEADAARVALLVDLMETQLDHARALLRALRNGLEAAR